MVKLVYCITKKAGWTDEEFFRYWKDVHGPLGVRIPGLRKLVQSAYSNDVNGRFQRDVDRHSGDVDKVGAQRRWDCNHA